MYYTLYTINLKICTQCFYYSSSKFSKGTQAFTATRSVHRTDTGMRSFSLWHSGSRSLEDQSDGPLSPSDIHPSSNPKQLMLSGVSLLAVSNVNNPFGLVGHPYVMWSAHFFVTQIQTEKISCWNGRANHVSCFMLARTSTETLVSRIHIR